MISTFRCRNWLHYSLLLTFCRLEISGQITGEPRELSLSRGLQIRSRTLSRQERGPKEEICTAWAASRALLRCRVMSRLGWAKAAGACPLRQFSTSEITAHTCLAGGGVDVNRNVDFHRDGGKRLAWCFSWVCARQQGC